MNNLDWLMVIAYIGFAIYLGIKLGKKTVSVEEYFSGGKSFKWWAIGFSVIATQVSAVTFLGAPGWSYTSGMGPIILSLNIPLVMWYIGGTFVPFFYNSGVVSIYEYLEKRFGVVISMLISVSFILKMLLVVGTIVYAPSLVLSKITGLPLNVTIGIITILSIFYTILGGIGAVIWTDVIQMIILWVGVIISFYTALNSVPESFGEIIEIAKDINKMNAFDFSLGFDKANTVWAGIIGGGIFHVAYFGVDQAQVQRVLTAKSMKNVKFSLWFSGLVSVIQMFVFLLLGIILYVYFDGREFVNPNDIYITFALEKIPNGALGLIISAIFAAAMSSIDSALNSMSTVYIRNIHDKIFVKGNHKMDKLKLSKLTTMIFGVVISGFAFLVSNTNSSILEAISMYGSYLLGSVFGVFTLGIYSSKVNEKGAIAGFIGGITFVAVVAANYNIYWMWNNLFGFVSCVVIGIVISKLTGNESKDIRKMTLKGQKSIFIEEGRSIIEDGVYVLPGKFERNSYFMIAYFVVASIFLYFL